MKAIGVRVEPTAVHYAVVEGTIVAPVLLDDGRYAAPKGFDEAESLTWYRTRTRTLLEEHRPKRAAIKYMESVAGPGRRPQSTDSTRKRHRIEGVLLQLLNEHGIGVLTGPFATVTARLGAESAKSYMDRDDLRGLVWTAKNRLRREAILAATAALGGD